MNKILFALLFASVSFSAIPEASAGKPKKPEVEETKIVGVQKKCPPVRRKELKAPLIQVKQDNLRKSSTEYAKDIEVDYAQELEKANKIKTEKLLTAKISVLCKNR